jgi:hypothetical protein
VRPARLPDARYTATTMLLVLKVPTRGAMNAMGWSQATWRAATSACLRRSLTGIADRRFEGAAFVSTTAGTLKRVRAGGGFGPRGDALGVPGGSSGGRVGRHRRRPPSVRLQHRAERCGVAGLAARLGMRYLVVGRPRPSRPDVGLGPERLLPGTRALPPADDSRGLAEQITQRHASDPALSENPDQTTPQKRNRGAPAI